MEQKICVITGGSSGIGLCTALEMKAKGYEVFDISRRREGAAGINHISADVTDEKRINEAVSYIIDKAGRIDVLINNAGFGISGAVEFTETADARKQFDVNFFGMVNMNRAVIPFMRRAGGGRIVNISSVAAPIAIPFQAYYSAAKAAINSYTMALINEVRPYGISVCAVQPGDICTGFTGAREKSYAGDEIYSGRISRSVAVMEHDEQNGMKPETAAHLIATVASAKKVRPVYTIGFKYRLFCALVKILPAGLVSYIVGRLFGG